jgi:NMD protein affecting ribosome stability and mRNA decay
MIYLRLHPDSLSSVRKKKSNKEHNRFLVLIRIAAYRWLCSLVMVALLLEQKVMTASRRKTRVLDALAERAIVHTTD